MTVKGYIYKYTFPDGKVYIGQTTRPLAARHREHITPSTGKLNPAFWSAWEKFGKADLEVLEVIEEDEVVLVSKLNLAEAKYIMFFHATNPECGYNRLSRSYTQGQANKFLKKEHDRLFSEAWGNRDDFYSNMMGKALSADSDIPFTEGEKAFIRERVFQYLPVGPEGIDIDNLGNLVNDYDEEPLEQLLFAIRECRGEEIEALSSIVWEHIGDNIEVILDQRTIQKFDLDGTLVKEYSSMSEVMHDLNLSRPVNVYNALEGKQKTAYGYRWKYKNKK